MQQVTMLHTMQQTTQQQLTQAQQMLHEMQHRYDRLLDMPRRKPRHDLLSTSASLRQYLRRLNGVDSMVNPPKFSHFGHHLINKNGIGQFRKQF
jgi:hypothetical protein